MDALAKAYEGSSAEEGEEGGSTRSDLLVAPGCDSWSVVRSKASLRSAQPKLEDLQASCGPVRAGEIEMRHQIQRNHLLGRVEDTHVQRFGFEAQRRAHDRGEEPVQRRKKIRASRMDASMDENDIPLMQERNDPASERWLYENAKSPWAAKGRLEAWKDATTTKKASEALVIEEIPAQPSNALVEIGSGEEELQGKSVFHGKEEKDYQGRSWLEPPRDRKAIQETCYVPKRHVHTWKGHDKGVSAIRFFPVHGHLLLSASMDSTVKIWDIYQDKRCMRTYMGHSEAVRDICFSNDGSRFVSCSWDRKLKLWDTETGKILGTYSTGKVPLCVKIHPNDDMQHVLLAGTADNKVVEFDMNTGEQIQQYTEHMGAVNTITFIDENRRFVTSSDDKTVRVWEYGIPVQIKYIAEPDMHSMPSIAVHPNQKWFVAQSLDNTVVTYSTKDRFRMNRKKTFKGHRNSGYACQVNFSHDGQFLLSGDAEGRVFFWNWKTNRIIRSIKAHDRVCIGCEWHPFESSKVATCGWDGLIKYWD